MFCPKCGKDNSLEQKFCASCGTNLEAVSLALSGREEDFFTKTDTAMDQFIARYSEHVFKNAPAEASERKVAKSWLLLGQAALTSLVDIILFVLMWNFLPLRFLILMISTPFRLLAERDRQDDQEARSSLEGYRSPKLEDPAPMRRLNEAVPSVTENTTLNLTVEETKAVASRIK